MKQTSLDIFAERYAEVAGHVHPAHSPAEAAERLGEIVAACRPTKAVLGKLFGNLEAEIAGVLRQRGVSLLSLQGLRGAELLERLNQAEIGLSQVDFAIAETGTVVEVSENDVDRLISSLPLTHVAFLRAREIVPTLAEVADRLREIYARCGPKCNITFISGPSRTADIEMKLFLGVHGPQASHVIVCDW